MTEKERERERKGEGRRRTERRGVVEVWKLTGIQGESTLTFCIRKSFTFPRRGAVREGMQEWKKTVGF